MNSLVDFLHSLDERSMIVGVGNALRGDDGLGPELVRRLAGRTRSRLLDAGESPEDQLESIVALAPGRLLIVDAVAIGGGPGAVALLEPGQLGQRISVSTHNLPLVMFIKCLAERLPGMETRILGVQPKSIAPGQALSPEVSTALDRLSVLMGTE